MAKRETYVKLFAPDGTPVEVLDTATEENERGRVEVLKERGYTTSKPRNPKASTNTGDTPEMAKLREELEAAKAENEALKKGAEGNGSGDGGFAPPKTDPPAKK